jgi:uncharacterized membrane protein
MPDDCWKWGSCYFNRNDPALVVPARSGFAYSFNMARPSLWAVASLVALVTVVSLMQSVTGLLRLSALR